MKAQAEISSQRRRPCAVAGGRHRAGGRRAPTLAWGFPRFAFTGALAALIVLGAPTLGGPLMARADEPAAPAPPAADPSAAAPPAADPSATGPASNLPPEELERQAESIARSIMSPFCPGRTVSACPVAGPWRDDIRRWVAEGVDALEIKRRLAERVPEHNLGGVPKNRLGWVLPVGLGIAALALLIFLLRRLVTPSASAANASTPNASAASGSAAATSTAGSGAAASGAKPDAASAAGGKANAAAASAPAGNEDYDARLQEELETLEQ